MAVAYPNRHPRNRSTLGVAAVYGYLVISILAIGYLNADSGVQPVPPSWKAVHVAINRDTWVSSVPGEQDSNLGGADRIKFKGIQELGLIDINPHDIRGRVIEAASLHLHRRSHPILRRVTVSSVTSPWVEGTAARYKRQIGAASFRWAAQGYKRWSFADGDVTTVINGLGNSFWGFADASPPDSQGWQVVSIQPRVIAARVAGISHGFAVQDDVGSEYIHEGNTFQHVLFPNRYASSREARSKYAPFIKVFLGARDELPPDSVGRVNSRIDEPWLRPGEAIVSWTTPVDNGPAGTLGFHVEIGARRSEAGHDASITVPNYLVPTAGPVGQPVTMHLRDLGLDPGSTVSVRVRPVDAAGNLGPTSIGLVQMMPRWPAVPILDSEQPAPVPADEIGEVAASPPKIFVVDPLDKVLATTGGLIPPHPVGYRATNHLWSAGEKQIRLSAARNEFVGFQLVLDGTADPVQIELDFSSPTDAPHDADAETAETTDTPLVLPTARVSRSAYVASRLGPLPDPLIPMTTARPIKRPGDNPVRYRSFFVDVFVPHEARAGIHRGTLRVHTADSVVEMAVDLNVWRFALPDFLSFIPQMNCYGLPDPPHEIGYYRLAHEHRTTLNRLQYNWAGRVRSGSVPQRYGTHIDWTEFDDRFGPLLDGSAFADLPRRGVPVDAFYLPINENWPMDIHAVFKDSYWADDALPLSYWDQLAQVTVQFARHFDERRWFNTFFEFYLNNKIYFKHNDWRAGSAPWIFDEPVNTQDFWALRQYGRAFHEGVAAARGRAKMVFRCDISRPQWQRDLLDGVMDVNVVSGAFRRYGRRIIDRKRKYQQIVYEYGSANPIEHSNVQPAGWCIDAWVRGADGVVPWQTVGTGMSWQRADGQSLFYPAGSVGADGPVPSVRLKAFRRGQQDVEYLVILGQALDLPREAIAARVQEILKLAGRFESDGADDAGHVLYKDLKPQDLWSLRMRVGALLDAVAPPPKRRWVHLRTPNRDPHAMTDDQYFAPLPAAVRARGLLGLDPQPSAPAPPDSAQN